MSLVPCIAAILLLALLGAGGFWCFVWYVTHRD